MVKGYVLVNRNNGRILHNTFSLSEARCWEILRVLLPYSTYSINANEYTCKSAKLFVESD